MELVETKAQWVIVASVGVLPVHNFQLPIGNWELELDPGNTGNSRARAPLAFHVSFSLPYEDVDCFAADRPVVVPARTFLSQLP